MDMDMGLGLDGDAAGGVGARGAGRLHGDCEADVWVGGWVGWLRSSGLPSAVIGGWSLGR